jgi:uncharacterized protein
VPSDRHDNAENATISLRSRLRSDLRDAMKARRPREVQVIRELLAAIDNAEAPAIHAGPVSLERHQFLRGSAEVERMVLGPAQVRALMEGEVARRERAAIEFEVLGELERADELRSEVVLAKRYLD